MERSSFIFTALSNWIRASPRDGEAEKVVTHENLTDFLIGPTIDTVSENETPVEELDDVKVKLTASHGENNAVWTCNAHIIDVPSDGNCGFHAFVGAATTYAGTTAIGTAMPKTASEGRELLVSFLRARRADIEAAVIEGHGFDSAHHLIWKDISVEEERRGYQVPTYSPNPTFEELCLSIYRPGLGGHWLASGIGEIELHLLSRALGVTLHCVALASDERGPKFLRQKIGPSIPMWSGALQGTPKGAIVVRFLGQYERGHYQIVRCGRRNQYFKNGSSPDILMQTEPDVPKTEAKPSISASFDFGIQYGNNGIRKRKKNSQKHQGSHIDKDVQVLEQLRGVQPVTKGRYSKDYRLINSAFQELSEQGYDPLRLDVNCALVVQAIKKLLMFRCGPKRKGYEGNKASSTGNVLLGACKLWYSDHGLSFSNNHVCVLRGNSVSGPPWRAQQVLEFKDSLGKLQAKKRSNPVRRAYLLTHDDVATAMRRFVAAQLGYTLDGNFLPGTNPTVDWMRFQTALMVTASFGSGARGAELVSIRLSDITMLSEGPDTAIGASLQGVKGKTAPKTLRKIIFPSWKETTVINPALAVLIQLTVVHGVFGSHTKRDIPLFPHIERNQIQKGKQMSSDTYSAAVKDLFRHLGITDRASEHSPRRGGSGFRYYVLGENLDYIRDFLSHESINDTITYVGFRDRMNSYVCQGYGTCGAGTIR